MSELQEDLRPQQALSLTGTWQMQVRQTLETARQPRSGAARSSPTGSTTSRGAGRAATCAATSAEAQL
eukprot:8499318-Pyramimonas_sp.AAC.1